MHPVRASLSLLAAALAGSFALATAQAQDFPSKPIKIIVPIAPGGVGDIVSRAFAAKLGEGGGPSVVVENRAGAAGVVGADAVAKSPADGYTLMLGFHSVLSIMPHLTKLPYDPTKDLTPVVHLVSVPNILIVHPSVPAKDVKELVAYAKANPGKLSYASQGVGTTGHIAGELFKLANGVDITHVPYKGAAPAAQDLMAGHVSMLFDVVSLAAGPIKEGRVRAIGVATKERSTALPDVPTLTEQGQPIEITAWFGLVAPAGTPPAAIAWINREANKAFSTPESRGRFTNTGATMPLGSADTFGAFINAETRKFGEVIRKANIKIE